MALLSQMIRTAAITGRPDQVHAWFANRQGGRWADQMVRDAMPSSSPRPPSRAPEEPERGLTELHARGILTDAELAQLRARLAA